MLEIIAQPTPGKEITLQLFPDTIIEVMWENPLFLTDRIPVAGTLSFSIPPTAQNMEVFNYPERITVVAVHSKIPGRIKHSGITVLNGEILLIQFDKHLELQFKGSVEDINTKAQLNQIDMGEIDFEVEFPQTPSDINYYNFNTFTGNADWIKYQQMAIDASTDALPDPFCIAPVKTNVTQWDGNQSIRGIMNAILQYVNFFKARKGNISGDVPGFQYFLDVNRMHSPVVPFVAVHHIIKSAFGPALQNNPFTQNDLAKLVVVSAGHPRHHLDYLYSFLFPNEYVKPVSDIKEGETEEQHDVYWKIKNFQQQYLFVEFLKQILKTFGMTLFRGINHNIEKDNDIFTRNIIVNWDKKVNGDPIIRQIPPKDYIFTFAQNVPQAEGVINEYDTWQQVYEAARQAMPAETINFKISQNPQVLSVTKTFQGNYNDLSDHILDSVVTRTALGNDQPFLFDDQDIVSSTITPLDMNIEKHWWISRLQGSDYEPVEDNIIYKSHWHVPVMGDKKKDDPPHIMLWAGRKETFAGSTDDVPYVDHGQGPDIYPYLTNHHTDHKGNRIFDFSLLPDVPDGIQQTFHSQRKQWTEKEKKEIDVNLNLSAEDIKNLDMRDKFYIRGKHFFIRKIQFALHQRYISQSEATLVES